MEVVAVDIGGTHARFAVAEVADGRVVSISEPTTQKVAEHPSLQLAWQAYGEALGRPMRMMFLLGAWATIFDSLLGVWQSVPYLFCDFWALTRRSSLDAPVNQPVKTASPLYRGYLLALARFAPGHLGFR